MWIDIHGFLMDLHGPLIKIVQLLNVKFKRLLERALLRVLCDLCALCGLNLLGSDSIIRSHDEQIITAKLTKGIKLTLRN